MPAFLEADPGRRRRQLAFFGRQGLGPQRQRRGRGLGSTGIPVYNMSAGCAAGGNAFNVGYSMVAGGVYDMVLVVGGEVMPKGMIQTSGVEEATDPEFLRQRCVGMPGPSFWATLARRRMHEIRHHRRAVCTGHGQGAQVFGRHNPTHASRRKSASRTCWLRPTSATRCACSRSARCRTALPRW
jgi:hypothetical protein